MDAIQQQRKVLEAWDNCQQITRTALDYFARILKILIDAGSGTRLHSQGLPKGWITELEGQGVFRDMEILESPVRVRARAVTIDEGTPVFQGAFEFFLNKEESPFASVIIESDGHWHVPGNIDRGGDLLPLGGMPVEKCHQLHDSGAQLCGYVAHELIMRRLAARSVDPDK